MSAKHLVPASEIEHRINIRPKEIAAIYGIAESVVYRAVQSGQLPARKLGKIWLIRKEDVDPWIEHHSEPNEFTIEPEQPSIKLLDVNRLASRAIRPDNV